MVIILIIISFNLLFSNRNKANPAGIKKLIKTIEGLVDSPFFIATPIRITPKKFVIIFFKFMILSFIVVYLIKIILFQINLVQKFSLIYLVRIFFASILKVSLLVITICEYNLVLLPY